MSGSASNNNNNVYNPTGGMSSGIGGSGEIGIGGAKKISQPFKPFDVKKKFGAAAGSKPNFGTGAGAG